MIETVGNPHGMNTSVLYGPVPSRRYGMTLGVNLFDGVAKVCNFRCPYCQLGAVPTDAASTTVSRAEFQLALQGLGEFLHTGAHVDAVVISGNGEPTLASCFPVFVDELRQAMASLTKKMPLIVLTNGTRLTEASITRALRSVDEVALKLDPNPKRANRPIESYDAKEIALAAAELPNLTVQACFIAETFSEPVTWENWVTSVLLAKPKRVDLYTIARQTAVPGLMPATDKVLRGAAATLGQYYKGQIRVFAE